MEERQSLAPGTRVISADGQQLGTIQSTEDAAFLIENDVQIPLSAIAMSREGEVHLSMTNADALGQRWTQEQSTPEVPGEGVEPGSDYTAIQGEDSLDDDPMPTPGEDSAARSQTGGASAGERLERPSGTTGPDR